MRRQLVVKGDGRWGGEQGREVVSSRVSPELNPEIGVEGREGWVEDVKEERGR